jgi:hypothetical protein
MGNPVSGCGCEVEGTVKDMGLAFTLLSLIQKEPYAQVQPFLWTPHTHFAGHRESVSGHSRFFWNFFQNDRQFSVTAGI